MKKKIICIFTFFICALNIFADSGVFAPKDQITDDCKIRFVDRSLTTKRNNYWFIEGFDFDNYDINYPSLSTLVDNEVMKINVNSVEDKDDFVIVGHSQGGICALAFAKRYQDLKENKAFNLLDKDLKGIITVSGIDQGIQALEGGSSALKARVNPYLQKFEVGVSAACTISPTAPFVALGGTKIFELILINSAPYYIRKIWTENDLNAKGCEQIADMAPNSEFIKNNVVKTKRKTVKVTKKMIENDYVRESDTVFYELKHVEVPVYKVINYKIYEDVKLDKKLPLSFIVAKEQDGINFAYATFKNPEFNLEETVSGWRTAFDVCYGTHLGLSITAGVLLNIPRSIMHATAANYCAEARDMLSNPNAIYNAIYNALLNSTNHDGVVDRLYQQYPKEYYDPETKKKVELPWDIKHKWETKDYNHVSIKPNVYYDNNQKKYVENKPEEMVQEYIKSFYEE